MGKEVNVSLTTGKFNVWLLIGEGREERGELGGTLFGSFENYFI